jgi:DNA polymerase-3 subunit gamma/tau
LFYQIGLIGKRDLPLAPDPRTGFEMVMLRMLAFRPVESTAQASPRSRTSARGAGEPPTRPASPARAVRAAATAPRPVDRDNWAAVVPQLRVAGLLKELAMHIAPLDTDADPMIFQLDGAHDGLLTPERSEGLATALSDYLGRRVRIRIDVGKVDRETPAQRNERVSAERQQAARDSLVNDPHVQEIVDLFDATVVDESIRVRK